MKIKSLTYAMLRVTGKFENDRAEVEVEIDESDDFESAVAFAKLQCERALHSDGPGERRWRDFASIMSTAEGVRAFKAWCAKESKRLGR
jgi:hypothetical protein